MMLTPILLQRHKVHGCKYIYSETWELGTPKGLRRTQFRRTEFRGGLISQVHFHIINTIRY